MTMLCDVASESTPTAEDGLKSAASVDASARLQMSVMDLDMTCFSSQEDWLTIAGAATFRASAQLQ
ncbi:MAG: hypothetical protein U0939_18395 [Pirellulales bacterium]